MSHILIAHVANGLGLHFFDWSLNFLNATTVVDNPMVGNTAHDFKITKISDYRELDVFANATELTVVQSFPAVPLTKRLIHDAYHKDLYLEQLYNTHRQTIEHALELDFKVIIVDWDDDHWLIPSYQNRYSFLHSVDSPGTREQVNQEWIELFFPDSVQQWSDLHNWDQREILALCLRPTFMRANPGIRLAEHFGNKIHLVKTNELWLNMDQIIAQYINIDQDRFTQWQPIYQQWRTVHDVQFSKDYWHILSDIVNNVHRDLDQYQMDFTKEALIQHGLIFAYNLNLKTWELDQFPTNTQSLTLLLEPNIHSRDFTYNLHY